MHCEIEEKRRPHGPSFWFMDIEFYIEQVIQELFDTEEYAENFLIEIRVNGNKYEVFVDGDSGVTVDKCRRISRYVEEKLEESGNVDEKYKLDISSPGAERPLTLWRQYGKHVGRTLAIELKDGSTITGKLTELGDRTLEIKEKRHKAASVNHSIPFADINESVVQISFN